MKEESSFSKREKEVIGLLMQGKSNKQIALALGIAERTVEFHLKKIYDKLQVSSAREAILQLGKSTVLDPTPDAPEKLRESTIEMGGKSLDNGGKPISRRIPMKSLFSIVVGGSLLTFLALSIFRSYESLSSITLPTQQMYQNSNVSTIPALQTKLSTDIISPGIVLPLPHTRHTLTRLLNGKILLVGGYEGANSLAETDLFDPIKGSINPVASLHTPHHDHSATLLRDGRVLIVGGYNSQQQWLTDAEIYDPLKDTWTVVPPLYSHGTAHTATLLRDGRVLVVGGGIGSSVCTERVEIFDPKTNSWTEARSLPAPRNGHTADLLKDGRVLVAGGVDAAGFVVGGDAFLYDPKTDNWTVTAPMVKQRAYAGSTQFKDGRVLVAGGIAADGTSVWHVMANAEIYDPSSNTWDETASLSEARFAYVLTQRPNGQVLAIGGSRDHDSNWSATSFVSEVELYDSQEGDWQTVVQLPEPSAYSATVLFHDGRLWVTGGYDGPSGESISNATWIIAPINTQP